MIFKGLLFAFFVFLGFSSNAQDWNTDTYKYGQLYKGYVIDNEGNKIKGFIKYRNRYIMQLEVIFFKVNNPKSPKKKYLTQNLSEYKVADKLYHVIPHSGGVGTLLRGNLVVNNEGCIKEYVWYKRSSSYNKLKKRPGETTEDFGERKFPSQHIYYKNTDGMAVTKAFFKDDFAKKMSKYLSSNKVLAKKVKTKKSGYTKLLNIDAIFKEFNESCQ